MVVPEAKSPVQATETTFRVLRALKDLDGAGVTELADRLDLPKSSVHSYLSTLLQEGYVVKRDGTYHVALRFLEFGAYARHRTPIYEVGKPEVQELARRTGELVNLLVEEHGRGIYIYRETGDDAVEVDAHTGHRVHLHNTALGKAILSELPRERVEEILDAHGMPATSPSTITDRDELYEELAEIRDRGVAFDDEERLDGLRCVAAPVTNKEGGIEGAISVSGPTSRMNGERFTEEIPDHLRSAVNVMELNITYR